MLMKHFRKMWRYGRRGNNNKNALLLEENVKHYIIKRARSEQFPEYSSHVSIRETIPTTAIGRYFFCSRSEREREREREQATAVKGLSNGRNYGVHHHQSVLVWV